MAHHVARILAMELHAHNRVGIHARMVVLSRGVHAVHQARILQLRAVIVDMNVHAEVLCGTHGVIQGIGPVGGCANPRRTKI